MNSLSVRAGVLLGLSWLAGPVGMSCLAADKPNIIFILSDDAGYGDLGCYGQKEIKTPGLDRFASEGIRFTDCYAGSTICAPSRCTLMTGYHTGTPVWALRAGIFFFSIFTSPGMAIAPCALVAEALLDLGGQGLQHGGHLLPG